MQGSYKNNGLPRPYYMKPSLNFSPYHNKAKSFFASPRRKVVGYLILLILFGSCMYWLSQDLKGSMEQPSYEIVQPDLEYNKNLDDIVGIGNADKESENIGLAGNLAQGSKGDIGVGVAEAPKGGMANEAPVVGNENPNAIKKPKQGIKASMEDKL
ncbi:uncharacterized protein AC631_00501 [Debaryomyces fabryi]|uniref:Uncharacterized protein n=1 Tax=Debaryomyces fabryi TaxID=58627 RepID=A0A0V1Q5F7_9ASCO|nr:uncharacterized protein AC631_00501 [Debaryomyces fabryi]KSA03689.1 hypothetical protein AC631_00501 [Debaryomyces fabryi]CUM53444.1 unnamed protein product [Debaryomyces fabryi]